MCLLSFTILEFGNPTLDGSYHVAGSWLMRLLGFGIQRCNSFLQSIFFNDLHLSRHVSFTSPHLVKLRGGKIRRLSQFNLADACV